MQRSMLMLSMLSAWAIAVVYDRIKVNTGVEIKWLLGVSVVTMVVGLYLYCRKPKETDEGEV